MENIGKVYAFSKAFAMKKILLTMTSLVLLMIGCSKIDNNDQSGEYPTDSGKPIGAINGLFTINDNGDQVYFSRGNLQYKPSTNIWRFAENQWDLCGNQYYYESLNPTDYFDTILHIGNVLEGSNYSLYRQYSNGELIGIGSIYPTQYKNEWIDAFGWGTSGWPCNLCYQPWESRPFVDDDNVNSGIGMDVGLISASWHVINEYSISYGSPVSDQDMTGPYADCDWGVYNAISNGGNRKNMWRTMTRGEWDYLLNFRYTSSGIRYATARIGNVLGIIVLPDDWEAIYYPLKYVNHYNNVYSSGVYERNWMDYSDWNILEEHGAVFLPLTINCRIPGPNGYMYVSLYEQGTDYWTASANGNKVAYTFNGAINQSNGGCSRAFKNQVRLVCPVQR